MPLKFSANLSFMFQEAPLLLDRYKLASTAGFRAVECANPYEFDVAEVVKAKKDANVKQILINTPIGKDKKEFGYAALGPCYQNQFLHGLYESIKYAQALECPIIHIMSGIVPQPSPKNLHSLINNLKLAKPLLEKASIVGVIEAINPHSLPNYFLNDYDTAFEVINEVDSPNIRLQLDIFHLQRTKGDLTEAIKKMLPYTSHIQIAQVPGRHEPDSPGEINYEYIFRLLEVSYNGYIGLEYNPIGSTVEGLKWMKQFGFIL